MGMSSYVLDNVEKFWDIAEDTASKNETGEIKIDFDQFRKQMLKHTDLLLGTDFQNNFEDAIYQAWTDNL
jgi:hypothetical protein|tara:strand:- start:5 stop:214 length:210 start_codon:yes stop_codon:yes gene_type:complete